MIKQRPNCQVRELITAIFPTQSSRFIFMQGMLSIMWDSLASQGTTITLSERRRAWSERHFLWTNIRRALRRWCGITVQNYDINDALLPLVNGTFAVEQSLSLCFYADPRKSHTCQHKYFALWLHLIDFSLHTSLLMLSHWRLALWPWLFCLARTGLVNITIDDSSPDPRTGISIEYEPPTAWNTRTLCQNGPGKCSVLPDAGSVFGGTWHESTVSRKFNRAMIIRPKEYSLILVLTLQAMVSPTLFLQPALNLMVSPVCPVLCTVIFIIYIQARLYMSMVS